MESLTCIFFFFSIFVISFLESFVHVDMRESQGSYVTVSAIKLEFTVTEDLLQVMYCAYTTRHIQLEGKKKKKELMRHGVVLILPTSIRGNQESEIKLK